MSTRDVYYADNDDFEYAANCGMNVLLKELYNAGVITEEQFQDYSVNYAVVLKKPGFFNKWWNKIKGFKDTGYYILVKQFSLVDDNEYEEPVDSTDKETQVIKLVKDTKKGKNDED